MKDLNAVVSDKDIREQSSFLFRISNIRSKLQNLYKKMTDYTLNNKNEIDESVKEVNKYKSRLKKADNVFFLMKTDEFRKRLRNGEPIENIMCEAIAVAREATFRKLGMFPYDVQVEAAIAMIGHTYKGKDEDGNEKDIYHKVIAEMKTGEGKTLVQILVSYLNLLEATKNEDKRKWKSVHIMTSNDALAKRDSDANRSVFEMLGFTCGYVPSRRGFGDLSESDRIKYKMKNYACDVVYASPSTIAFDYLHDNIIFDANNRYLKRSFGFALIDEADDILIDQATNPLKLSAKMEGFDDNYERLLSEEDIRKRKLYDIVTAFLYGRNDIGSGLTYRVYNKFFKEKNTLKWFEKTDEDVEDYAYCKDTGDIFFSKKLDEKLVKLFPDEESYNEAYFALLNAIRARHGFIRDREYNVSREYDPDKKEFNYKVVIIDQNTGRKKLSNRYVDGIQEAIEAKEEYMEQQAKGAKKRYHITYSDEMPIRAMFTYPDFLSIYEGRVSGMTGTSDEEELNKIYGFNTYRVQTRKENIRIDEEDELYATKKDKYRAIIREVKRCVKTHQPVLIGTTSVKESIEISTLLKKNNIVHNLLNANNEAMEAELIKVAGMYGAVTVATNMAGRGTDIKLGGENATPEEKRKIVELGGLYVIGTSKNKSARIDTQLRGRAARQGDPGKTKYFFSLEDDLIKEQYKGEVLNFLKEHYSNGLPIKNKKVLKAAKRCQELRESKDKLARFNAEKFNISFMKQRKALYEERNRVLDCSAIDLKNIVDRVAFRYASSLVENNDLESIKSSIGHMVNVESCFDNNKKIFRDNLSNAIKTKFNSTIRSIAIKDRHASYEFMLDLKKKFLNIMDVYWIDHINSLEELKSSNIIASEDSFKDYEYASTFKFYHEVIPSIYNEMLTYATNPDLKFGDYYMKQPINPLLVGKMTL